MKNLRLNLLLVLLTLLTGISLQAQQFFYPDNWADAGFNLTDSKAGHARIIYSIPQFSLETVLINGEEMKNIVLPGNFLHNEEGAPNLPGRSRYIAIPAGAKPVLKILAQRTETILNVNLAPAPNMPAENDDRPLVYQKNSLIYTKNAFYPEAPVGISEVEQIRGVDVVSLGIMPFQYNPVTRTLVVYRDLKVEISFEGGSGKFGQDAYRSRWWEPILEDAILNYPILPKIDFSKNLQKAMADAKSSDECEYIIITPTGPDYLKWADSIRRFRNQQGILTKVFPLDQIGGNDITAIKNFITNAYNNWTIKPAACLLLGDYGTDITKHVITTKLHHPDDADYPVDNKYADVNNDNMPEIVFARMAVNDGVQLKTMITKFLNYERNPPANPLFYQKPVTALGWQTVRWFQLCSEIVGGFFRKELGKEPRRINAVYEGNPSVDAWSTALNTSTILSYFGPNGLNYIPSTPQQMPCCWTGGTAAKINQSIDSGAFMVIHRDHGNYTGWGEPAYSSSNINQLSNIDLPFVFSINCQTGGYAYSGECFMEKFMRHTKNGHNAGALGVVAPSAISYSFVNDTYLWGVLDNMWPNFMPAQTTNPPSRGILPAFGMAAGKYFLKQSSWPSNPAQKIITYNLFHMFGDAFCTVYSEVPQQLSVVHDSTILLNSTTFSIAADADALIALTVNDSIIATGVGNGATPVVINIPVLPLWTEILVTVTKQNYYRYSGMVDVVTATLMANFKASNTTPCSSTGVNFTDKSTGDPTAWSWTFEGGTPSASTERNPAGIVYDSTGTYTVSLTVTKDGNTQTLTREAYIVVSASPIPGFTVTSACLGMQAHFTNQSDPNGGTISGYLWNFGDPNSGNNNTSVAENPTHYYMQTGTYSVTLTVTNDGKCVSQLIKTVGVTTPPGQVGIPEGETTICQGSQGNVYSTTPDSVASYYSWMIEPAEAGSFAADSATTSLNLSATYHGTATITVKAVNDCAEGLPSAGLTITINPVPVAPDQPAGADSVDLNKTLQSEFSIPAVSLANSYIWTIDPVTAGTITGNQLLGTVAWNSDYRGSATITVKGVNDCGEGFSSAAKTVTLFSTLSIDEPQGLNFGVFPNPNSGIFMIRTSSKTDVVVNVSIYNPIGSIIYSEEGVSLSVRNSKTLNLGVIPEGVYYLKVEGTSGTVTRKIIVKR